jgi:peptidoglycan/LPS O-acetylase OafA/YrhL
VRRLECLDGLRGALALYVLLSHMAPFAAVPHWVAQSLSHGEAAVDVFFILSGMVIVRSLESFGYDAKAFLIARAARIFPVFLLVFPVAVAVQVVPTGFDRMPWIGADSPARSVWSGGWPASWAPEIAAHLTMTHGLFPDGVLPDAWVSFLGASWSLSTEWQFYALVASLAGWLHRGRPGAMRLAWLLLVVAAAGLAWQAVVPDGWRFSRAFLPNKAQYFALGIAASAVQREPRAGAVARYALVLAATFALCIVSGGAKFWAPFVWTVGLSAQMAPRLPGLRWITAVLSSPLLLWLGAVSYCIYLINEPVQKALGVTLAALCRGDGALFTACWLPGAILLPLGLGWLLHITVEQAGQRWGRRVSGRVRRRPEAVSAPTVALGR